MVKQYRKRAAEVEALQWDGTAAGATPIIDWILQAGATARYVCSDPERCSENDGDCPHWITFTTPGLASTMLAYAGEWIVRGNDGEFYLMTQDRFADLYEEVE